METPKKRKCVEFDDNDESNCLPPLGTKVINDPVHGHMEFHPLCVAIIDTPQFQRLRDLKQLGAAYYVYPGASHNRFEHCLGVCFLAKKLVTSLRNRQQQLEISDEDVLCVQIAGLCHDLGHGPFSHMFDNKFIPLMLGQNTKWTHEKASIDLFDYMVHSNDLDKVFEEYGIDSKRRVFIKELIFGEGLTEDENGKMTKYYGPETGKGFLYEIVNNQRTKVDVDKWDYFQRDCHHLGISCSFDHLRCIKFARVIKVDGERQICLPEKEAFNMYEMYHTRHSLHRRAYQHKVVQAIELMIVEAMKEADLSGCVKIPGKEREYKISECIYHMDAYTNLTDYVLKQIQLSKGNDNHLVKAQEILRNLDRRRLYKCVGESVPIAGSALQESMDADQIQMEILEELPVDKVRSLDLNESSFVVQMVKLDYGKGHQNPIDSMRFYSKSDHNTAVPMKASEVSFLLPQQLFKELLVRLYLQPPGNSNDRERFQQKLELLKDGFKSWCKKKGLQNPKEMVSIIGTPADPRDIDRTDYRTPERPTSGRLLKSMSALKARQSLAFSKKSQ